MVLYHAADRYGDASITAMLQIVAAQKQTFDLFSVHVRSAIYLMTGLV
jgi:hypothetical protein